MGILGEEPPGINFHWADLTKHALHAMPGHCLHCSSMCPIWPSCDTSFSLLRKFLQSISMYMNFSLSPFLYLVFHGEAGWEDRGRHCIFGGGMACISLAVPGDLPQTSLPKPLTRQEHCLSVPPCAAQTFPCFKDTHLWRGRKERRKAGAPTTFTAHLQHTPSLSP